MPIKRVNLDKIISGRRSKFVEPSLPPLDLDAEEVVNNLRVCDGNIQQCAILLGLSYSVLYKWLKNNPQLWMLRQEIIDKNLDECESQLMSLIKAGNLGAIMFYLKCQGKRRGWIEKPSMPQPPDFSGRNVLLTDDSSAEKNSVDLSRLGLEELQQLRSLLNEGLVDEDLDGESTEFEEVAV